MRMEVILLKYKRNLKVIGGIGALIAIFLWSLAPALVKLGITTINIPQFVFLRYCVSALLLLSVSVKVYSKLKQIKSRVLLTLFIASLFFVIPQAIALNELSVGLHAAIFGTSPILTFIALNFKVDFRTALCLGLGFVGTLIFADISKVDSLAWQLSVFWLIVSLISWIAITVLLKRLLNILSSLEATALISYELLIGSLIVWGISGFEWNNVTSNDLITITALGFIVPAGLVLFSFSLKHVPKFGIATQYFEPGFGVMIGYAIFSEVVGIQHVIAIAIIFLAVFGIKNKKHDKKKQSSYS